MLEIGSFESNLLTKSVIFRKGNFFPSFISIERLFNYLYCSCYFASWTIHLETDESDVSLILFIVTIIDATNGTQIGRFARIKICKMWNNEITWFPSVGLDLSHPQPVLTWTFICIAFQTGNCCYTWASLSRLTRRQCWGGWQGGRGFRGTRNGLVSSAMYLVWYFVGIMWVFSIYSI